MDGNPGLRFPSGNKGADFLGSQLPFPFSGFREVDRGEVGEMESVRKEEKGIRKGIGISGFSDQLGKSHP